MQTRVVLVSPAPLPEPLVALVPGSARAERSERAYGHVLQLVTDVDDPAGLRDRLRAASAGVAVGVLTGRLVHEPAQLILTDVDSTLTTTEAIDLLAEHAGVGPQVAKITERAMRGELDFAASLHERVATLAGLPTSVLDAVAPRMTLSAGAEDLIAAAHAAGAVVGATSGGFSQLVGPLAERLGLDFWNAITLETSEADGVARLTGRATGPIVDRAQKARDLQRFAAAHDVDPALTVAVGDGANDLAMLEAAGLGIAYCAKPVTAAQADVAIGFPQLDAVAAFAGFEH